MWGLINHPAAWIFQQVKEIGPISDAAYDALLQAYSDQWQSWLEDWISERQVIMNLPDEEAKLPQTTCPAAHGLGKSEAVPEQPSDGWNILQPWDHDMAVQWFSAVHFWFYPLQIWTAVAVMVLVSSLAIIHDFRLTSAGRVWPQAATLVIQVAMAPMVLMFIPLFIPLLQPSVSSTNGPSETLCHPLRTKRWRLPWWCSVIFAPTKHERKWRASVWRCS